MLEEAHISLYEVKCKIRKGYEYGQIRQVWNLGNDRDNKHTWLHESFAGC